MDPRTPDEWLSLLTKRLDERTPGYARRRQYTEGKAPLPEMGDNLKRSWEKFQRKARTDYGGIAVSSLAHRIIPNGIVIGSDGESLALTAARRIWRDNQLDVQIEDMIDDYLKVSVGYLVAGLREDGKAAISREAPEQFYADPEPLRPWKARAGVKAWRDPNEPIDRATLWAPGLMQNYFRSSYERDGKTTISRASGGWLPYGPPAFFDGGVPIAIMARKGGKGFVEPHEDVLDRINLGKLNRLVITAILAFKQRAIKGNLPEKDEEGKTINWDEVFSPAPGALWELPDEIDIWESKEVDIRPLLDGETTDARDFAAVTGTPISELIPDSQNQSSQGALNTKERQVTQAAADIRRISPGLALVLVYALRAEGHDLGDDTVEMLWAPPEHISISEKYAAATQAKGAGLSQNLILRDIIGLTPDQIAQEERDIAKQQLALALLGGGGGGSGPSPATGQSEQSATDTGTRSTSGVRANDVAVDGNLA